MDQIDMNMESELMSERLHFAHHNDGILDIYDSEIDSDNEHNGRYFEQDTPYGDDDDDDGHYSILIPRRLEREFQIQEGDTLQDIYDRNQHYIIPETLPSPINGRADDRIIVDIVKYTEEEEEEEDANVFTCPVCLEEDVKHTEKVSSNCRHPICMNCLAQHIAFSRYSRPCCVICRDTHTCFHVHTEHAKNFITETLRK